jgi:hypothetical protein
MALPLWTPAQLQHPAPLLIPLLIRRQLQRQESTTQEFSPTQVGDRLTIAITTQLKGGKTQGVKVANRLRCQLINARSLCNKVGDLHQLLYNNNTNIDCIFVTETWLYDGITNGLLDPEQMFTIIRRDRTSNTVGGGVCMFVKKSIPVSHVDIKCIPVYLELLCLDLFLCNTTYRFFIVYRPTESSSVYDFICAETYMEKLIECIEDNFNSRGATFILGDFNCPSIDWARMCPPTGSVDKLFYDFVISNGYTQCVEDPTRQDHTLDLVITNEPFLISTMNVEMPFSNSDHNTVKFDLLIDSLSVVESSERRKKYLWKNGNYTEMCSYLSTYNWDSMFTVCLTADNLWLGFTSVLNHCIEMFVPYIYVDDLQSRGKYKKYPRNIRILLNRKRCLWRVLRRDGVNLALRARYRCIANECKQAIRNYEINRESKVIESRNTGTFYKYVNKKLSNSNNVGPLINENGEYVVNDDEKASLLNCYFSSVNVNDNGLLPPMPYNASSVPLESIEFTPDMLIRLCKKINPKLTCDPDNYSPFMLKQLIHVLSYPLSHLFNSLISVSKSPSEWKRAIITPIFKKRTVIQSCQLQTNITY